MGIKAILLLLVIFLLSSMAMVSFSEALFAGSFEEGSISLGGNDSLLMPDIIVPESAGRKLLLDRIPVCSRNQPINGTLAFPPNESDFNIYGCISPFDMSIFFPDDKAIGDVGKKCDSSNLVLDRGNCTNCRSLRLSIASSGMHLLNFFHLNGSHLLFSIPLLVTEGQTILQSPNIVQADEPFIQVAMNTTIPGNQSKIFAAILISRSDYKNASLSVTRNGSANRLDTNLSLGSKFMKMNGQPKVSNELLMDLLPLLPASSAIGLQESTQQGADLILLPDKSWVKGEYILTGGIYSPGNGLLGIKQSEILIV
jgi:hypothetical protein